MTQWLTLLVGLVAVLLIGVATYAAWWALFKDRSKGRRRCPRCWHDLTHTHGLTCTECGTTVRSERALARTRRRWAVFAMSIIACVGSFGFIYWKLGERRWPSYIPTRVLIAVMPVAGSPSGKINRELNSRVGTPKLTDDHWAVFVRRCANGDPWNQPGTDGWRRKYGHFLRNRRAMVANNASDDWLAGERELLLDLPAYVEITSREVWPIGVQPRLRVRVEDWWPLGGACRVTVTPRLPEAEPVRFRRSTRVANWAAYSFSLEGLLRDADGVDLDVVIERREPAEGSDAGPWITMSMHAVHVPLEFSDDAKAGLAAVEDTALTEAIWETFSRGAVHWAGGGVAPVRFNFTPQATHQPMWNDTAIGVSVEVLRGDEVARQLDIWWLAGANVSNRNVGWEAHGEDLDLLAIIDETSEWTMRVTGDAQLALRAGDARKHWSGQFTFPLTIHRRNGRSPEPIWWQDDGES